jgi:hypothetical protein
VFVENGGATISLAALGAELPLAEVYSGTGLA